MIGSISDSTSIALAGLQSAQSRAASDAFHIETFGASSGTPSNTPGIGNQRYNPTGALLGGANGIGDLISNVVDLAGAAASYKANAAVFRVSAHLARVALDTVS